MVRFLVGAVAALGSVPALAAPAPLPPIGKWQVHYAEEQCVAGREFGNAKAPILLLLKPSPTSDVLQIVVSRKGPSVRAVQAPVRLSFGSASPMPASELRYSVKGQFLRSIVLNGDQAKQVANATRVTWEGDGDLGLTTGSLGGVVKALETCRENLRSYWNVGPGIVAEKPNAIVPLGNFFGSFDYPGQALRESDEGRTSVVLLVDEKGSVRDCMVEVTSGIPTLDTQTCSILKLRAKFTPAKGSDGKPIRSAVSQAVRWKIR